ISCLCFNFAAAEMTVKCIFVMGVSGCGKTTIGKCLADKFVAHFEDADDYHSEANRAKMSRGIALNDEDRYPWLQEVANLGKYSIGRIVIACSALKKNYRQILSAPLDGNYIFVYLNVGRTRQVMNNSEFMSRIKRKAS
uniref:gluconokinase n=1 Tax=Parascaris univalens TaxID=6257 RepID=A0A915AFI9_PARUN